MNKSLVVLFWLLFLGGMLLDKLTNLIKSKIEEMKERENDE